MSARRPWVTGAGAVVAVVLVVGAVVALIAARGGGGGGGGDAGASSTTLQFRPVLGQAEECRDRDGATPNPKEPTAMTHQGRCVGLGPSVLNVRRAGVSRPVEAAGGVTVQVNLTPADTRTFAQVTEDYVGEQIAVVAFGRVLVAPVVREPIRSGQMELSGLTRAEADRLRTAFTP